MKKVSFALIMTILISIVTSMTAVFAAEPEWTPPPLNNSVPDTTPATPRLVMTGPNSILTIDAGTSKTIEVPIKNTGTANASGIEVVSKTNTGIAVTMGEGRSILSIAPSATATVLVTVSAPNNLDAGTYQATVAFTYQDVKKAQYEGSGSFTVVVNNDKPAEAKPNLLLKDIKIEPDYILPGSSFRLSAVIQSTTAANAKNVQVVLGGLSTDGISMTNATNNVYYETFDANASQAISFELTTNSKMKSGSYPLTLTLKYKDKDGADYSVDYSYYAKIADRTVASNEDKAVIEIIDIVTPPGTYDVGQGFEISFTVVNRGKAIAKNIKVMAKPEEKIVPKSANTSQIMSLAPGQSQTLVFSFAATSASVTQNYTVGFNVEYENGLLNEDDTKQKDTFDQYAGVNIVNSKADAKVAQEEADKEKERLEKLGEGDKNKNVPKITISDYKVDPIMVMAGAEFDLYMTFRNTHAEKEVKNIIATLTVPTTTDGKSLTENVFTPVNASNTFYVERIPAKGSVDEHVRLYAVPDAAPKNYILIVKFEYEDAEGNPFTSQTEIGINVRQTAELTLGEINMPTMANADEPIYLEFSIQNTGKVDLNNLKITLSGEGFNTTGTEMIFGNFASGGYDYYSASFTPTAPGKQTMKLIVSYDESTGAHVEDINEYTIDVGESMRAEPGIGGGMMEGVVNTEMDEKTGKPIFTMQDGSKMTMDDTGNMVPYEGGGGVLSWITSNLVWVIGGGVAVVAVAAGVIIFLIKRKKGTDVLNG